MKGTPGSFERAVQDAKAEYDAEGELEGWLVTLECRHQYWIGAETTEGEPPSTVRCSVCESRGENSAPY